jgi:peptide/nickel transport system substrate-binding protein
MRSSSGSRLALPRHVGQRVNALVGVALAAVAVSACGGSSSSSSASNANATATTKGKAPSGIVAQTLNMQFNQPVSLNPALEGTDESDIVFGALDYDSLTYQLADGSYVGDLATSWSYAPGSHNEVFNLTLRPNVHFSDGSLMTPKSVVASLEYFKNAHGPQSSYLATMTSATATGANTVQLKFSAPEPQLPFLLSQYQCIGQIIGPQGLAHPASLNTSSDGTGPYVLSPSQSVAGSSYLFTLNSHYWNPSAVHYRSVVVKVIADPQTALSAAQSGQIDAVTSMPALVANAAKADGLQVYQEPFSIATLILMDRGGSVSPLGKLQVREAINEAVNRPALAKGLGGGAAVPTDELALPGTTGYDPSLADKYPYDPANAKKLLAAAGYPHGFTLPVIDTLALDPNGDFAAALKSELSAIGVQLQITETPSPAQFIPAALSKKYPAAIFPQAADGYGFPWSVAFGLAPFQNAFGTTSPQLQQLLGTAGALPASASGPAYEKVDDYLVDNAWYVPLFSLEAAFAVRPTVANVQPPSLQNTSIDPVAPNPALSWYPASG